METANSEIQYCLNSVQLKGIKNLVKTNINLPVDDIISLVKEYTSVVSAITDVRYFVLDEKPYILVQTPDTGYFIKLFKLQKVAPLELK